MGDMIIVKIIALMAKITRNTKESKNSPINRRYIQPMNPMKFRTLDKIHDIKSKRICL